MPLCFDLRDCQVGDYIFHIRERLAVPPDSERFYVLPDDVPPPVEPGPTPIIPPECLSATAALRIFDRFWTPEGICVWVRKQ